MTPAQRTAAGGGSRSTLNALLARALLDVRREIERPGEPSLLAWADLLRVIPEEGVAVADLARAGRISRRAAKSWFVLQKAGWLDVGDQGDRRVRLTPAGCRVRDRCAELVAAGEQRWGTKLGSRVSGRLRAALEQFVGGLELELPHYPMIYGTADRRALGGMAVAAKPGPPPIPAHGTDWSPVVRDGGTASAVGLPFHALLSQALMAFTIDYEAEPGRAMAVVAKLVESFGDGEPVRLDELPPVLGVTGSGKSGLERHGVVRVGGDRMAELTPVGKWICDRHDGLLAEVVEGWGARYGGPVVDELVAALSEVDELLPEGLPDYVMIGFVVGKGFVDVSAGPVTSARA